ncbi:MAG TPA: aminoacyl-tRNA hydrolase [Candidatus Paceibacterota bacterium]|jgi:PTH1 family peptidyl-tRNA hydrolase|nr:aminoacyl-tRNA hydrolase [Candidatus Paceibacterota bacterium]
MYIVIGLGNPGSEHAGQRHNVGWMVLDALAAKEALSFEEKKIFAARISQFGQLLLAKPDTFMNDSGLAAEKLRKQHPDAEIVVVYDDININLGEVKCSYARGDGGHNGLTSLIAHLGTKDFLRIRVGIRPVHEELLPRIAPPDGFQKFMLSPFAPFEAELRDQGIEKAVAIIESLPFKTKEEIMNQFN